MYSAIIHRSLTCFKREHSFYFLWQEYLSNSGSVEWNILQIQAIGESVLLNCTYRNSSDCRLSDFHFILYRYFRSSCQNYWSR